MFRHANARKRRSQKRQRTTRKMQIERVEARQLMAADWGLAFAPAVNLEAEVATVADSAYQTTAKMDFGSQFSVDKIIAPGMSQGPAQEARSTVELDEIVAPQLNQASAYHVTPTAALQEIIAPGMQQGSHDDHAPEGSTVAGIVAPPMHKTNGQRASAGSLELESANHELGHEPGIAAAVDEVMSEVENRLGKLEDAGLGVDLVAIQQLEGILGLAEANGIESPLGMPEETGLHGELTPRAGLMDLHTGAVNSPGGQLDSSGFSSTADAELGKVVRRDGTVVQTKEYHLPGGRAVRWTHFRHSNGSEQVIYREGHPSNWAEHQEQEDELQDPWADDADTDSGEGDSGAEEGERDAGEGDADGGNDGGSEGDPGAGDGEPDEGTSNPHPDDTGVSNDPILRSLVRHAGRDSTVEVDGPENEDRAIPDPEGDQPATTANPMVVTELDVVVNPDPNKFAASSQGLSGPLPQIQTSEGPGAKGTPSGF